MFTRNFKNLSKLDVSAAGGKGASLGEMTQAGIAVPPGFVVLSEAFEKFIDEQGISADIDAILHKVKHQDTASVERASEEIKGIILGTEMPKDIATEIKKEFKKLGAKFVAVRSSATAEDSSSAAWAGQLDSFLNTNEGRVLENVKRCWASLFTPRAIFYRFEKGLHKQKISVAVVVQKMVESEVSGIAFSVHPVTQDRNQLIIEASYGLGEAIVSGQVTPDSYVVEKKPRQIIERTVQAKTRGLFRLPKGENEWKTVSEPKASKQAISDKQILELSELILHIENHYGFPCDIEWAFEKGKFYIVQSRPITTLQAETINAQKPEFISPALAGFNPSDYHFDGLWKNDLFATCFWQDCWVPNVVKDLGLDLHGVGVMNVKGGHYLVNKPVRARMDKQIKRMIDEKNKDFFRHLVKVSDRIFTWAVEKGKSLGSKKPTLKNFRDFVDTAKKLNFLWLIGATYTNWPVEERLQEAIIENAFPPEHALDIIPKIVTPLTRYHEGLVKLKKVIGGKSFAEVEKDRALFAQLKRHAEEYVWVEIFNFIGEPLTPERLYDQVQHLKDDAQEHGAFVPDKPLSPKLKFVAECMHHVGYVKQGGAEYFSIFSERTLPFLRSIAEEIGVTYREFMCLLVDEVDQALQGTLKPNELKKRAARRIGVNDWAVIGGEDGKMIFIEDVADINLLMEKMIPRTGEGTKELIGQIGNRGKYTGPVRIVMNTYDFDKVKPGDVLVTTMTTPDFIALMQKSGAIITDIGGLLCHAAIVSREIKKPCVIGTKFATQLLKDDDMVEVDANEGVVRILGKKKVKKDDRIEFEGAFTAADYQRLFKVDNMPYIISEAFGDHYKTLDCVLIFDKPVWITFIPKSVANKTLRDGLDVYGKDFPLYRNGFAEYKKRANQYFKNLDKNITKEQLQVFLDLCTEFFSYYSKTEFFYTDKAFEQSSRNKILKKNLRELGTIKNSGREFLNKLYFGNGSYLTKILTIIGKKFKIDPVALSQYSKSELIGLFEGRRVTKSVIHDRSKAFLMTVQGGDLRKVDGAEAKTQIDLFLQSPDHSGPLIRGVIANKGKATGKVKIIHSDYANFDRLKHEIKKMEKGAILVAETTSPELMNACRKAAAIVTNQGGLMSHAAIVSREFDIPCIVGTGNVTEVLKDGDMVEVDANEGIVRILSGSGSARPSVPDISKFDFTFESAGTSFLFEDVVSEFYVQPDSVSISRDNVKSVYVTKKYLRKMNQEGLTVIPAKLAANAHLLEKTVAQARKERAALAKKKNFTKADMMHMYETLARICGQYFQFDFAFWDETFERSNKDRNAKKKVAIVQSFKNKIRAEMDPVFFTKNGYLEVLKNQIAKHSGISGNKLSWYRCKELIDAFDGKTVPEKELNKRKKEFAVYKDITGQIHFYAGDEAHEFSDTFLGARGAKMPADNIIKGKTAHATGKLVRGKVRIIARDYSNPALLRKQMAAMKQGEILVSQTTDPELMPAIRKAAALVTDTGGLLSHTAIVARELDLSCVIETMNASKILKTGDMVEVDADKGIVKILTKK